MFMVQAYAHFVEGLQRARTTRIVNGLPPDIQKDIGWPGYYPDCGSRLAGRIGPRR